MCPRGLRRVFLDPVEPRTRYCSVAHKNKAYEPLRPFSEASGHGTPEICVRVWGHKMWESAPPCSDHEGEEHCLDERRR